MLNFFVTLNAVPMGQAINTGVQQSVATRQNPTPDNQAATANYWTAFGLSFA